MQQGIGIESSANGLARRRWARIALCLLFVFSMGLHVGYLTPTQAYATGTQIVSASGGDDPCEPDHVLVGEHCNLTSSCPFCAPVGAAVTEFDRASTNPPITAEAFTPGGVIDPQFRPPRLPLQA